MKRLRRFAKSVDLVEFGILLAVILVLILGVMRLVGPHTDGLFSETNSAAQ